jgi:hypothetical protein
MVASLSVLAPITIVDALLTSSTVPETDYAAWSGGTTYAVGDRVINTSTHRKYESLRATNSNHDPSDILNRTGVTPWWLDIGPTNKWAMFDSEVSTQTSIATPLTVVIKPGAFNGVFLAGLDGDNLIITVKDSPGGATIYYYSGALEASAPGDYYEYFFDRFMPQTDFLANDIDSYANMEITISITKASGTVKCGVLALGDLKPLGLTQYGAKAKPKTYSYIKIDEFGNNTIIKRKTAKDMSATSYVKLEEANYVLDTITELLGTPCVWIGTGIPQYSGLRVFGLGSAELSYDQPEVAMLSLNVQGLI